MLRTTLIAAAMGAFAFAAPAGAAPLAPASAAVAAAGNQGLVESVQYRRYYGPRYGYRGGYYGGYRYNRGAAVGAGIAAGAIGALAAGALLAPGPVYAEPVPPYRGPVYAAPDADAIAYCSRRFRSYDPATGTYIANGGVVRACP